MGVRGREGAGRSGARGGARAASAGPTLQSVLSDALKDGPPPVYLLSGDEFLISQAVEALVDALVPESSRAFNLSMLDGASTDAGVIARDLAQAPMLKGTKLVVVRDTTLLTGKSDLAGEVSKARQLFEDGRKRDAARRLLAAVGKAKWTAADLTEAGPGKWEKDLGVSAAELDREFLVAMRSLIEEEGISPPKTDTAALEKLLEGGAPTGNVLVLTSTKPDRRLALTKLVEKLGTHLPRKAERVGRGVEDLDVSAVRDTVLARHGKRLEPEAERALKRAIGEEMRLLAGELEKVCLFVGDRDVVRASDVAAVGVKQIREEAFWELGNSVCARDLPASLWYLHDAFEHGKHAVPILAGIASALRKALQVRAVAERHAVARAGRDLPARVVEEVGELRGGRKPHPYALRMELERGLVWPTARSLTEALSWCREADRDLKTSRGDPRLVIEQLLMRLCGGVSRGPGGRGRR